MDELRPATSAALGRVVSVARPGYQARLIATIRRGLGDTVQKWLPAALFYDDTGSELFEAITRQPEYYPTRTEAALLTAHAAEVLALARPHRIVEFGSGSSAKTRLLFDAYPDKLGPRHYMPIDISESMLRHTADALITAYPGMSVQGLAGDYDEALAVLPRAADSLVLFLGSSLGNFRPDEQATFFTRLTNRMGSGSHLLLGIDRSDHGGKPVERIRRAYDDAAGVTAAFNLNMLRRLNREFGANFDLAAWAHRAVYNAAARQIEMHLVSRGPQTVTVTALSTDFRFRRDDSIRTEISRKFSLARMTDWLRTFGFAAVRVWTDPAGLYGLLLLRRE
ncbi:MAG: L-histidine N(alpha)-methyltransferase [Candidatus Sericytochromatia bacterium]|nr:L-histidine N(alpha)-methyltransferase [Candidatus Sericytochromatia bacterium]